MKLYYKGEIGLIQQIRLIHAISEISLPVFVDQSELWKFEVVERVFGQIVAPYNGEGLVVNKYINVLHSVPLTSFAGCEKNLLYPKSIVEYCKNNWNDIRHITILFQGLITEHRKKCISEWLQSNHGVDHSLKLEKMIRGSFLGKLLSRRLGGRDASLEINGTKIMHSISGRQFPLKSWDAEYYQKMCNSNFTLCPSGDFIWSYRFFEACMCGSIPIIEDYCSAYGGFYFYKFKDSINDLKCTNDMRIHNYQLMKDKCLIGEIDLACF